MTPTQRQAIELAISDFEHISAAGGRVEFVERRIAALRAVLAEPAPVQEPEDGKRFHAKFNVGDRVWYMKNNRPTEVVISAIEIFFVNTDQDRITYNAENAVNPVSWLDNTKLQEANLFKSKTDLLESL